MRGTIGFQWPERPINRAPKVVSQMPERPAKLSLSMRKEEFGCVVYNPITDELYECNKSAASIMEHLDGKHTVDEIADMLAGEFDIESSVARKDVEDFLKKNIYMSA